MQGIVKGFKYTDTFKLNSKAILKGVGCISPILERRLRRVDRDTLGPPEPWPITWQAPHSPSVADQQGAEHSVLHPLRHRARSSLVLRPLRPVPRVSRLKMLLYLHWSLSKVPGDNQLWNVTSFPRLLPLCPVPGRRPTPIRMQGTRVSGLCTSTL